MSTETIFFGMSTGTSFACRRRQSCLACRRGQPFWHVDGRFGMSTRRIPTFHQQSSQPLAQRVKCLNCCKKYHQSLCPHDMICLKLLKTSPFDTGDLLVTSLSSHLTRWIRNCQLKMGICPPWAILRCLEWLEPIQKSKIISL